MVTKAKRRTRADQAQARFQLIIDDLHALGAWQVHVVIGKQNGKAFKYLTLEGAHEAVFLSKLDNFSMTLQGKPEEMVETVTDAQEYVDDHD